MRPGDAEWGRALDAHLQPPEYPDEGLCYHCGEAIEWGFTDYSDTPGWVHTKTQEFKCDPEEEDGHEATYDDAPGEPDDSPYDLPMDDADYFSADYNDREREEH